MDVDAGNRITFNNIAVHGTQIQLAVPQVAKSKFIVYPNPSSSVINIGGTNGETSYRIIAVDGKLIESGQLNPDAQINVEALTNGIYLLQVTSEGVTETKKIIKN